jgi:hypothetical protein
MFPVSQSTRELLIVLGIPAAGLVLGALITYLIQ